MAKLPAHRPISASIDALSQEESAKLLKSESMRSSNLQGGGIRKRIRMPSNQQAATIIRNTNATANSSTRDSMNMETHIISRRLRDGTTVFSGGLALSLRPSEARYCLHATLRHKLRLRAAIWGPGCTWENTGAATSL